MLHSLGPGRIALDTHRLHSPIILPLLEATAAGKPLQSAILQIVRALGFDSFMYGASMSPRPGREAVSHVLTTLPDPWLKIYQERNFIEIDPRLNYTFEQSAPFIWDQASERNRSEAIDAFLDAAAAFGICSGVTFALGAPRGGHAIVAFNSREPYIDPSRRFVIERLAGDLHAVATCVHDGYVRDIADKDLPPAALGGELSPRQRICLVYVAHFYRNSDIATKLNIAERTVEVYLSEARDRLGATTTQHAVLIATRRGIIRMGEIEYLARPKRHAAAAASRLRNSQTQPLVNAAGRPLDARRTNGEGHAWDGNLANPTFDGEASKPRRPEKK